MNKTVGIVEIIETVKVAEPLKTLNGVERVRRKKRRRAETTALSGAFLNVEQIERKGGDLGKRGNKDGNAESRVCLRS